MSQRNLGFGDPLWIHVSGRNASVFPPTDQGTLTVEGVEDLNQHGVIADQGVKGPSYITLPILIDNVPTRADSARVDTYYYSLLMILMELLTLTSVDDIYVGPMLYIQVVDFPNK